MSINFHDANNKYTYANRNAHISWQETINNIVDVQNKQVITRKTRRHNRIYGTFYRST